MPATQQPVQIFYELSNNLNDRKPNTDDGPRALASTHQNRRSPVAMSRELSIGDHRCHTERVAWVAMWINAGGQVIFAATDVAEATTCAHRVTLKLRTAEKLIKIHEFEDPALDLLQQRGREHEAAYVAALQAQGLTVTRCSASDGPSDATSTAHEATVAAMHSGVDVIVQPHFSVGDQAGVLDILRRVETASDLGAWSYEVYDTKLARTAQLGAVMQVAYYSAMLTLVQGHAPIKMHLVAPAPALIVDGNVTLGASPFAVSSFLVADFAAYFRNALVALRTSVSALRGRGTYPTYPEPCDACGACNFAMHCESQRLADDHLSQVPGATAAHRAALADIKITTVAQLAVAELPTQWRPSFGKRQGYNRLVEQAAMLVTARDTGRPTWKLRSVAAGAPDEHGRGLGALPTPNPGDVFLDLESDLFAPPAGLDYLFGWATRKALTTTSSTDAGINYHHAWATSLADERRALDTFWRWLKAQRQRFPDLHMYHFGHYERSALGRMTQRHGVYAEELDQLLRGQRFVDLGRTFRDAIMAGVTSYGLKAVEPVVGATRAVALRDATRAKIACELALESGQGSMLLHDLPTEAATLVAYNRDDCAALPQLQTWLEARRDEALRLAASDASLTPVARAAAIAKLQRPKKSERDNEKANERAAEVAALVDALLVGIPADVEQRTPAQHARWLLAHTLEFHQREARQAWALRYQRLGSDEQDMLDDHEALRSLEFIEHRAKTGEEKSPRMVFAFPPQESSLAAKKSLLFAIPGVVETALDPSLPPTPRTASATIASIDFATGRLVVIAPSKNDKAAELQTSRRAVLFDDIKPTNQVAGLLRFAHAIVDGGIVQFEQPIANLPTTLRAGVALLTRHAPLVLNPEHPATVQPPYVKTVPARPRIHAKHAVYVRPDNASDTATLGHDPTVHAMNILDSANGGVLAIQGPPGAGKSTMAAAMILQLVAQGKRVGVCANSHSVVLELLSKVVRRAADGQRATPAGLTIVHAKGNRSDDEFSPAGIQLLDTKAAEHLALGQNTQIIGGTAFFWSREALVNSIDVLLVDEAGQAALPNVLAIAPAAPWLVLIGDPQQLEQPIQAAHPDGSAAAALVHFLDCAPTIAADRGIFLAQTFRLAPAICAFTSEMFYQSRLVSAPGLSVQALHFSAGAPRTAPSKTATSSEKRTATSTLVHFAKVTSDDNTKHPAPATFAGAGLHLITVAHQRRANLCPEEVSAAAHLVDNLLADGSFIDRNERMARLRPQDILIVAPYNVQVQALRAEILPTHPGLQIGSVDKFQGREAPVVIYSMCASTVADAPRGLPFLFDLHRLNVATSRAQAAVFLLAAPTLLYPACRTPDHARRANALARYAEMATHWRCG